MPPCRRMPDGGGNEMKANAVECILELLSWAWATNQGHLVSILDAYGPNLIQAPNTV